MTSPNLDSTGDVPDAANAKGINSLSNQSPAQHLQGNMNQVVGPLGAVASGLMGGIAGGLIAKANSSAANGVPTAMTNASAYVDLDAKNVKANSKDPVLDTIVTITTQVTNVQQVIAAPTGVGFWETGPDPTGVVSFPFSALAVPPNATIPSHSHSLSGSAATAGAHTHTITGGPGGMSINSGGSHLHSLTGSVAESSGGEITFGVPSTNATASYAPWAAIRCPGAAERKILTFIAKSTGAVSTFAADLYLMDEDGSVGMVTQTVDDYAADLQSTYRYIQMVLPQAVPVEEGDVVWVQLRMTGGGSVQIAGVNLPMSGYLDGFYPRAIGAGRNPSSVPSPSTINSATFNGLYTGLTPWVSFGLDVGQTGIPRFFFDDFNRSDFGSQWTLLRAGSVYPRLKDGYAEIQTDILGTSRRGAALVIQSMRSDVMSVEADVTNTSTRVAGLGACLSSSGAGVWLMIGDSWAAICTGAYTSYTERVTTANAGAGHWKLAFDPALGVWAATRGGEDIGLSWTESGVPHGKSYRRGGLSVLSTGSSSARIDNFIVQDVVAEEDSGE